MDPRKCPSPKEFLPPICWVPDKQMRPLNGNDMWPAVLLTWMFRSRTRFGTLSSHDLLFPYLVCQERERRDAYCQLHIWERASGNTVGAGYTSACAPVRSMGTPSSSPHHCSTTSSPLSRFLAQRLRDFHHDTMCTFTPTALQFPNHPVLLLTNPPARQVTFWSCTPLPLSWVLGQLHKLHGPKFSQTSYDNGAPCQLWEC